MIPGALVVTGFRPFQGRGRNGAQTVVANMRGDPDFAHITCTILDVAWNSVERFCAETVKNPDFTGIIGLGEGHPGRIAIEMVARNRAAGTDEAGVTRNGEAIAVGQPIQLRSRLRYATDPDFDYRLPVVINQDAGDFLCNFALFHFNRMAVAVSGFIHLPPQGDQADDAYVDLVKPVVADVLRQNFRTMSA